MSYTTVIGLEIHAELLTKSKVFCACENSFGGEANTRVCPVCAGMPGALPVLNKAAVMLAVRAGLCLGCKINNYSSFDRKNYFYPDLPKAYQITQQDNPICSDGIVTIGDKNIRINRIHIEEDAGKLIHSDNGVTLVDFNRCGIPLIEIVTEPDFNCAKQVCDFVEEVCLRLKYAGVCNAKLEEGSLRVDVNISLMPKDAKIFGTRAEIKNLNSLKSISAAIAYEIKRQSEILDAKGKVIQQTRRFDEKSGKTSSLRQKEGYEDYRYFHESDLLPIHLSDDDINEIKNDLPELPQERLTRYINDYALSPNDATLIIKNKEFSDFYDKTVMLYPNYKGVSAMMLGELNRNINNDKGDISNLKFNPKMLAELIKMQNDKKITRSGAKMIFAIMYKTGKNPTDIAAENNLFLKDNSDEILEIAKQVLAENPDNVKNYHAGKTQLFGFFMGQIIRKTGKGVNPETVGNILNELLNN